MNANPDIETLKLTLWVSAGIISLLLVTVAFFLRKQIAVSETLTRAIDSLTRTVTVLETQNRERNPVIQKRLNEHADRLDRHGERLVKIETKLNIE